MTSFIFCLFFFIKPISQQYFIATAWNFNTFFVLACHIAGFIFAPIKHQLPLKWRCCLFFSLNRTNSSKIFQQLLITVAWILTALLFKHAIWWISFLNISNINFVLNDDFDYYVYSHQSGGFSIDHWLTDLLF